MLGEILGIVGILVSVIATLKTIREKKPYYCTKTITVIDRSKLLTPPGDVPSLTIKCGDQDITELHVTEILFWNGGREQITQSDLHEREEDAAYHLRVQTTDGGQIFGQPVFEASGINNKLDCRNNADGTAARISFRHLAYGEGFIITVTHTGKVSLMGELVGLEKRYRDEAPAVRFLLPYVLAAMAVGAVAALLDYVNVRQPSDGWLFAGAVFIFLIVFVPLYVRLDPIPRAFRTFIGARRVAAP